MSVRPDHPSITDICDLADAIGAVVTQPGAATDGGHVGAGSPATTVRGVDLRAQHIEPGDLFAALAGGAAHGAEFADVAVDRGARAILTDAAGSALIDRRHPGLGVPILLHDNPRAILGETSAIIYGRPSEKMQVIGVTGTSGKTTTAFLIEAGLAAAGRVPGLIGTIETRIAGTHVPSALTTPEAPQLHALLATMAEHGTDTVVMEVSSHALALGRVDGTVFAVGVFTNLSQDHLDFHSSMENYFEAKARLFAADSTVRAQSAVICVDDSWGRRMVEIAAQSGIPVRTVSTETRTSEPELSRAAGQWSVRAWSIDALGTQFFDMVDDRQNPHRSSLRLPGLYNVANALLAAATCAAVGVDVDLAVAGMASVDVPGRVQRIARGQGFLAVVDYAHKPAAVEAVIETLRSQSSGRIAIVFGAGGNRDGGKRPLMGAAGARGADLVIITDDNPRREEPALIREAVLQGALSVPAADRGEVRVIASRRDAIFEAVAWARDGDVVLVAGKGHETGQEINGVKQPFDDRTVLADAIDTVLMNQKPAVDRQTT